MFVHKLPQPITGTHSFASGDNLFRHLFNYWLEKILSTKSFPKKWLLFQYESTSPDLPTRNAMTSVKVVTLTATPACFIVCPNLSVIEAGAEVDSAIIKGLFKLYVIHFKDIQD